MTQTNGSWLRWALRAIGGGLVLAGCQWGMLVAAGVSWSAALDDTLVTQMTLLAAAGGINLVIRFYHPEKRSLAYLFLSLAEFGLIGAGIAAWIQYGWLYWMEHESYVTFVDNTIVARVLFNWLMLMLATAAVWITRYHQEQAEQITRRASTEQMVKDAELTALRQQLHPHFLFNSLNSISALTGSQPERARIMVQQLSDFLRGTLRKDDRQMVTLQEELDHLGLYLDIEKVRFGHRLHTDILHDQKAAASFLPSLILQPIMENAIKFGLYDTVGDITIHLHCELVSSMLEIKVTNPFDPRTAAPRTGTGYGLSAVRRRLFLLYGRTDLIHTAQVEDIFTTTISIPQS